MPNSDTTKNISPIMNAESVFSGIVARMDSKVPLLANLRNAANLRSYADDIWSWQPDAENFPHRDMLQDMIGEKFRALYGESVASGVKEQLQRHFVVETGPHIALPRDLDRISSDPDPAKNINTLVFHGTVYMAALQHGKGNLYNVSLYTARTPPSNENSARYFQPTEKKDFLLALISNKFVRGPHSLIPAVGEEKISGLEKELQKENLSSAAATRAGKVFSILRGTQSGVADQASAAHSFLMTEVMGGAGMRQVTGTFDIVDDFVAKLLTDKNSLLYRIFSDPSMRDDFIESLSDIKTGWKKGETPFDTIKESKGVKTIAGAYDGDISPEALSSAMVRRDIIPKNLLSFMAAMVEGGMLPLGGMFQCEYCSEIRDRTSAFLDRHGFSGRAQALRTMPVHIATLSPTWGASVASGDIRLLSYSDALSGAFKMTEKTMADILSVKGTDSYTSTLLCLNDFMAQDESEALTIEQRSVLSGRLRNGSLITVSQPSQSQNPHMAQDTRKP